MFELIIHLQGLTQVQDLPAQKAGLLQAAPMIQEKALHGFVIFQTAIGMDTDRDFVQSLPFMLAQQDGVAKHRQLFELFLRLDMHGASLASGDTPYAAPPLEEHCPEAVNRSLVGRALFRSN